MRKISFVAWALACAHGWGWAQTPVTDPAAPVPAVPYRSAFDPATHPASDPAARTEPLWPAQAVQRALSRQPELFTRVNMSAFERAQTHTRVLQLSRNIYRAWIDAVAARQSLGYLRDIQEAAQAAAELAQRMAQAGNWSKVQRLQAQLVLSGAATQVALAQQQAFSTNERLVRQLGLWGEAAQIPLPQRLPDLPTAPLEAAGLEETALRNNPALMLANTNARLALAAVGAQELPRWQQATDVTLGQTPAAPPAPEQALATLPVTAPLLDTQRLALSHPLEQAANAQARANALAVTTRSQAREAYYRYRTAYDLARHARDEQVQINTALQEETQLRYNGMLQSTWDLLASARARVQSINAALQAQRDFWLAHTDLQAVLAGGDISFAEEPRNPGASADANKGH